MNNVIKKMFADDLTLSEWFPVLGKNAHIEHSPGSTKPTKRVILTRYDDFSDLELAWAVELPIGESGMPIIPGYFGDTCDLPLPSVFLKTDRERFTINVAFGTAMAGSEDQSEIFKFYPPERAKSILVQLSWPNATDAKSFRRAQAISKNLSNVAWSRTCSLPDGQCCFILLKKTPSWQPTCDKAQEMINELIKAGEESINEYRANLSTNRSMLRNLASELNELAGMSVDFEEASSPNEFDELVVYFGDKGCRVAATAKILQNLPKYIELRKEATTAADVIGFLAYLGGDD